MLLITGWKEEPMIQAFDEGMGEEEICVLMSDDWQREEEDLFPVEPFRSLEDLNDCTDQFEFKMLHVNIKVKS